LFEEKAVFSEKRFQVFAYLLVAKLFSLLFVFTFIRSFLVSMAMMILLGMRVFGEEVKGACGEKRVIRVEELYGLSLLLHKA
jgi:hypothetical protein